MKIYIATWGNPFAWKETQYRYGNEILKSCSTLEIIDKIENPDKIIIISLDSIADQDPNCINCKEYNEIVEIAKNKIQEYIVNNLKLEYLLNKTEVITSLSVGEFQRLSMVGQSTDFYFHTFHNLSKFFIEYFLMNKNKIKISDNIEIIIDISHGINFMPVICYSVTRMILNIWGFLFNNLRIRVLNSDPFIGQANPQYLNINVIEETRIVPRIYISSDDLFLSRSLLVSPFVEDNLKKEIVKRKNEFTLEENNTYREALIFLSAFYNKLPLYSVVYLPNKQKITELINKIINEHLNYITVEIRSEKKLKVQRNLFINHHFENLLKVLSLISIFEYLGVKASDEVEINELKNLNQKLFENFSVEKNRVEVEIEEIKQKEKYIIGNFREYINIENEFRKQLRINTLQFSNTINRRNFFAHAGLEYNSIKIKKVGEKIFLKVNEIFKKEIENILLSSL
ncbi:MAG: CRISPR-associated CARF protein Csx1 [Candidatus Calescibacterium sp.]|nr:CRISPR-associated CARF protein Csx1 [Candidatus Calescibacterium sp.]MDW8133159.1 CRISPR-associated CARF protein Csx1 [Candidatus Calescibacterium sp.]